jgi:hypothetical protein
MRKGMKKEKKEEENGMGKERSAAVYIAMPVVLTCDKILWFMMWSIITRIM